MVSNDSHLNNKYPFGKLEIKISPKSFHLDWRIDLIWSKGCGLPKNLPINECWKRSRPLAMASPSKLMNSVIEAFSLRNTGPSTNGEGFERFLMAAAISA